MQEENEELRGQKILGKNFQIQREKKSIPLIE
jgi:hypothetical protein